MKIISVLFLLHLSFVFGCPSNTLSNNQLNINPISNEINSDSINKHVETVFLKVIEVSSEKAVLELSNETNKTIYLFYAPDKHKTNVEITDVFRYWFRCKEKGKKEIDYNQFTSHVVPSLDLLEKDVSFRFEISPLPKINADCKVSLLYYDDEKIVDFINNKIMDLGEKEFESIEKAKKYAEVKFRLNFVSNTQ